MVCLQESWRKGRVVVRGEEKPYIVVTVRNKRGLDVRNGICKSEGEGIKCGERKE